MFIIFRLSGSVLDNVSSEKLKNMSVVNFVTSLLLLEAGEGRCLTSFLFCLLVNFLRPINFSQTVDLAAVQKSVSLEGGHFPSLSPSPCQRVGL